MPHPSKVVHEEKEHEEEPHEDGTMETDTPAQSEAPEASAEACVQWKFQSKASLPRVVRRRDDGRRTALRRQPGDDCAEEDYHEEACDVYDGVDVLVERIASRGEEMYALVRTMLCPAGGWIKREYLVTRKQFEAGHG